MRPPDVIERPARGHRPADRPSGRRWFRPGHSLVLVPAVVAFAWAVLIALFATVSHLATSADERGDWGDVAGAAIGNFVLAFVLTSSVSMIVRFAGRDHAPAGSPPRARAHAGTVRRVARGGALGALPGLLIGVVPLVLADLDVISGDQSQIGFIGLPLLLVGTLVGVTIPAAERGCSGPALIGTGAGLAVGVGVGLLLGAVVHALGVGFGGIWLLTAPVGMIVGGALAVWLRLRRGPRPPR